MPPPSASPRYEIKELLGEGGMGMVYRALDTRTNSYVALKTLRDATDPMLLEMFKREWALLGEVPHPNIVDVRDVDEIEEGGVRKPCFIMPLLPGCTLAALIKASSPRLTTDFVINMVTQVCKGLQAAHEKDLIHRDLKPSNIFIMEDDTAKIIDFGLVHAVGNKSTTGLKGTWQYMSPEQIDGSKHPNRSFDIFSLGVVAYEALTGHQPFKRARFEDTVEAVRFFVPQAISERNPKVPQLVSKAIHVAMAKQQIHRYSSAREFAETLQKAHRNEYIERFDPAKIRPRIDRAKKAFNAGDSEFASEILTELEAEGNLDTDITLLRSQIDEYNKHRKVRQLFEAAQTRLEQDEIPLALEKLQEVLKIDPQNPDALQLRKRIEAQRSQQQVTEWLELARKHLERHDFSEARRALKEVFNLKYDDPDAARLKTQVDAREKEVETARAEKEHLYSFALRHNQNGEISSALSKLEKLLELSRNTPGASVPERDKVFQAFYNDVRTERDRIDNAYSEGTRHLAEKNFDKALAQCDTILARYPKNPQFQALRLKIEHAQRHELSAYIAEVGRAVETEPNLDRRVGILEEACKRYPNESGFGRQLALARELRDLVASIVNRARNYEEQGQFAEATAQWNTLSNIHPQYPGIDFEVNQLERRREQQAEEDKKARFVEKIDRALGNAAYADAERLSEQGLVDFPGNPELLALARLSRQGLEQTSEANRLFEEAKVQRAAGDWDHAVALLRQALELDKRNIVILNTLVNLLTERAHALLDTDPAAAEPLAAEANQLDPEHPSVTKVIALIEQAKRRNYVEQTVLRARELQSAHRAQAIDILKEGLTLYPGDGRLQQTLGGLQTEEPRTSAATALGAFPGEKTELYPVDPTALKASVAEQKPNMAAGNGARQPAGKPATPPPQQKPPKPPRDNSGKKPFLEQAREAGLLLTQNVKERFSAGNQTALIGVALGLVASAIAIGLGSWYLNSHKPAPSTASTPSPVEAPQTVHSAAPTHPVAISTTPNDATLTLDGNPIGKTTPPLEEGSTHRVAVSRLGYVTIENPTMKVNGGSWNFKLDPQPLRISVSVSESKGSVWLDDKQVDKLDDGAWSSSYPVKTVEERHVLAVKGRNGDQLLKIAYTVSAGGMPQIEPLQTKDLMVATSLGKNATIYAGNPTSKLVAENDARQSIPPTGLAVNVEDTSGSFPIANGRKIEPLAVAAGPAPALSISLNAAPNFVQATVTASPKNARLFVDGPMPHPRRPGIWTWLAAPGNYPGKLTADGMQDLSFSISLKRGVTFNQHFDMKPKVTGTIGPKPAILTINNGDPGTTVKVDNAVVGELDEKGNGRFQSPPGTHTVQLSKDGYGSNSFFSQTLTAGKEWELRGDKHLKPVSGFARIASLKPADAVVTYSRSGETEKHRVSDPNRIMLTPGTYEFAADAPKFLRNAIEVKILPNQVQDVSFDLQPLAGTDTAISFVSPTDAQKVNGDWYHGTGSGSLYVPLNLRFKTNTLLLSKQFRVRKMSWRVYLDSADILTYTLDAKGLSIVRRIDGVDTQDKVKDIDLTNPNQPSAYAVQINIEKNAVTLTRTDGTAVTSTKDEKHDWSHARIYVKADNYFTVWPGR